MAGTQRYALRPRAPPATQNENAREPPHLPPQCAHKCLAKATCKHICCRRSAFRAAQKFFNVQELFDTVLSELSPGELLNYKRVSKHWKTSIERKGTFLNKAMFLAADHRQRTLPAPSLILQDPGRYSHSESPIDRSINDAILKLGIANLPWWPIPAPQPLRIFFQRDPLQRLTRNVRNQMFLTQPPSTEVHVYLATLYQRPKSLTRRTELVKRNTVPTYDQLVVKSSGGVAYSQLVRDMKKHFRNEKPTVNSEFLWHETYLLFPSG